MERAALRLLLLALAAGCCRSLPDPGGRNCSALHQAACGERCVPFLWLCNGEQECPDGTDEHCEAACRGDVDAWQCDNGRCISSSWLCDGTSDCRDGSDERNCVCEEKKIPCRGNTQCIDPWEVCDLHEDCEDGSDEANCPQNHCLPGQWQCKNKVCIMEDWKCNGVNNCGDSSDEDICAHCPEGMILCDEGKCILGALMCNGAEDCLDGTDELSTCGKNCSVDNGGCVETCTETSWGVRCSCGAGWELQADGQNCTDVDECSLVYSPCSQLCENTLGSFTCECVAGYELHSDTICEVVDNVTQLLVATGQELALLDVRTGAHRSLIATNTTPGAIAYDLLRGALYWIDADKHLRTYTPWKGNTLLYPDVEAVNSIAVDWFTGQLYWASSHPQTICAGLRNGRGYVKVLEKNLMPEQLTVYPMKRSMYWVNRGEKGKTLIEAAGMDGSDRQVLAVVSMEEPVGLTLDYVAGRLYWISEYKESIETVKVDGSGRYTFPEMLLKDQDPVGLVVFENWFFWADAERLLSAPRSPARERQVLWNTSVSAFTVLHELQQQPGNTTACAPGLCSHLCLLSPIHPKGYKCACPEGMVLLPPGTCAELTFLYATPKKIFSLQVGLLGSAPKSTLVVDWPQNLHLQDVDWRRGALYWTDDEGDLMRFTWRSPRKEAIRTGLPVCSATVDIASGDVYWLTCDRTDIRVCRFTDMATSVLYRSKSIIAHLFLDWPRATLYWLEDGKPLQQMNLAGGEVQDAWNETWSRDIQITLDTESFSFLWSCKNRGLQSLSLAKRQRGTLKESWPYQLAAAYEPYLVSVNKTALLLWDQRTMEPVGAVTEANIQKVVVGLATPLETVPEPMTEPVTVPLLVTAPLPAARSTAAPAALETTTTTPPPLSCPRTWLPCRDGSECISQEYLCDGERDCKDGSDEEDCAQLCNAPGKFRCLSGTGCLEEQERCDGVPQCPDGSDELDCWKPTQDCARRCDGHTRCVPESWLCDGHPDCLDEADEQGCVWEECSQAEFQCKSGQCISSSLRCDGDKDCKDHSDEEDCAVPRPLLCPLGEVKCPRSGECVLADWVCDGDVDCKDGTDEQGCKRETLECGAMQWACGSGDQCVPDFWRCDRERDCGDGSDEMGCEPRKCQGHEFLCRTHACLNYSLVCNGARDCADGSDEGGKCLLPCGRLCAQICYPSPDGPRCACRRGYRLSSNGISCADVNECQEQAPCSQTCVNTNGSYSCTCHPGYLLEPDAHKCKVTGSEPMLLVAIQSQLLLYGLRHLEEDVLTATDRNLIIFSVDYDLVEQKVFWMDLNAESIKWIAMKTKKKGTLVKGIKSDCIAVDWVGRNLYWTDGIAGELLAIGLNTTWRGHAEYTVVLDGGLDQPRSLVLQPLPGLMYWSEIGDRPQIERAGMDGSNRKIIIDKGLGWPTGIALDLLSWRIFWSDDKLHCIGSAHLDGTDMKVFQLSQIKSPFSVTVFEDEVYWSEMKTRTVQSVDKRTGKKRAVLLKRHGQPYGLKILHEALQPRAPNPCQGLHKGSCRCPLGDVLADEKNCIPLKDSAFVLLVAPTVITQVYLKKLPPASRGETLPEHRVFPLTNVDDLTAIDYSVRDKSLYFADRQDGYIRLLRIKDFGKLSWKRVVPVEGTVVSLALDWLSGNIYWVDGQNSDIRVATADGHYTLVLSSEGLQHPVSIALHPPTSKMCLADWGLASQRAGSKIECASMDGSRRKVLWKKAQMPVGLTFGDLGTRLYWADQAKGVVASIQLDGAKFRIIRGGLHGLTLFAAGEGMMVWTTTHNGSTKVWHSKLELMENWWFQVDQKIVDVKIYSKFTQQGSNGCSENNGGCGVEPASALWGDYLERKKPTLPAPTKPGFGRKEEVLVPTPVQTAAKRPITGSRYLPPKGTKYPRRKTPAALTPPPYRESRTTALSTWELTEEPSPSLEGIGRGPEPQPCSSEVCNLRGDCTIEEDRVTCSCMPGYSGDYCEKSEAKAATGPVVLGLAVVLLVVMAAVGAFFYLRRQYTRKRTSSTASSRTLTSYHKDSDQGEEENLTNSETFINDAYDKEQELVTPMKTE
nr:low-density lipoprotein receptor-related protein 2-like [Pelodiscus sinensis]|eukprot:XP_025041567.1 low-density lipoprotein receptor-related protein 2-like [Pelodiscus sinensis]